MEGIYDVKQDVAVSIWVDWTLTSTNGATGMQVDDGWSR